MYAIQMVDVHVEVNDALCSMNRNIFTSRAIMQDMCIQAAFQSGPIKYAELVESAYSRRFPGEMETDRRILKTLYEKMIPVVRARIMEYNNNGLSLNCGISFKGGHLLVLDLEEIPTYERNCGKDYLYYL